MKTIVKLLIGMLYACVGFTTLGLIITAYLTINAIATILQLYFVVKLLLIVGTITILLVMCGMVIFFLNMLHEYLNDLLWTHQRKKAILQESRRKEKPQEAVKAEEAL